MRVADYIMRRLADEGISALFMVTGRGMLYLSDAAAKEERLNCVSVHHEQAASFAAMAYAQASGIPGVCVVSTGCAGTNAVTGVLCAWQDEVPCIFISGQNTLKETVRHTKIPIRTYGQQEADIVTVVSSITKYAVMIENANDIAYEMDKALYEAKNGRKGPVWIDVPLDIQNMRIEEETLRRFVPDDIKIMPVADMDIILQSLAKALRPVLLIGSGCRDCRNDLVSFVEKIKVPVVYENSAVDIYGRKNSFSIGAVGSMGANRAANMALQNADLVVALGCKLTTMTVGNDAEKFARSAKIITIDIDNCENLKNTIKVNLAVVGDISLILKSLYNSCDIMIPSLWFEKCLHWKKIFPLCEVERKNMEKVDLYALADSLTNVLPDNGILVCDAGLEELIMPTTIEFGNKQNCIQPVAQGCMGYALPASYGAYLASSRPVTAVIGDGSVMMNLQEFQTIAYKKFPIKIIIVNNNCYAVIRKRQKDLFRTRTIGNDASDGVSCPDFAKVADCFGIKYMRITGSRELESGLEKLMKFDGAVICEIDALEDQTYLHSSYARTKSGKFVQRPLEDQSPYLPRDIFLSEMIIEPIDQ